MTLLGTALVVAMLGSTPELLPAPQKAEWHDGRFNLPPVLTLSVPDAWSVQIDRYAWILAESLAGRGALRLDRSAPAVGASLVIQQQSSTTAHANGYVLEVAPRRITVTAPDPAGVFNAFATLAQLIEQAAGDPPAVAACRIEDWPALPLRAVHIDLTCQQYPASYVQSLMRTLARYKVNGIFLEYSDMFAYRKHADISRPDAFTEADVAAIRRTAADCNQEIIPFLQCLGHLDYLLQLPAYAAHGRTHDGYMFCPSDGKTMPLVCELIDELLDQHPGIRYLHVGGDEVSARKCPACLARTQKEGFSRIYVDHYRQVAEHCLRRGVTPLLWSDMMLQYPEALDQMPRGVGWVMWEYDAVGDPTRSMFHGPDLAHLDQVKPRYRDYFGAGVGLDGAAQRGGFLAFGHALGFQKMGFTTFIAPAARSSGDNFALPRFRLHMANTRLAFLKSVEFKLPGAIVTSWSYRGSSHEVCLPEYVCSAAGWNTAVPDIKDLLARFFRQRYGIEDPALASAVLDESTIVPRTTLARPTRDHARRAWLLTSEAQFQQIEPLAREDPDKSLEPVRRSLASMTSHDELWRKCIAVAPRHRDELRHWELARGLLEHRLQFIEPLVRTIHATRSGTPADDNKVQQWKARLRSLNAEGRPLRTQWIMLYRDINTPAHLKVELEQRFDVEEALISAALAGK